MKVIYQSKGGATAKLAKAIADTLKIELWNADEGVDVSKIAENELLFVGSGVYAGKCADKIALFMKELGRSGKKTRMALFGSSMGKEGATKALRKVAEKNGFSPLGDALNVSRPLFVSKKGEVKEADINSVVNFATRLTKN